MKRFLVLILALTTLSCGGNDDDNNNNCRFLLNVNVNYTANLNFPQFLDLQSVQNPVPVPGEGNGGLIIMRTIGDNFVAWDRADPSHTQESCSIMTLQGTQVTCNCDDGNQYDLNTGLPLTQGLSCGLKPYRVEQSGNLLFISN